MTFTVGARLQFGYATVSYPNVRWGWWSHLPQETEPTRAALQAISDDDMRARVMAAFRGWHEPIEALVATTATVMRTPIYDVPSLPTWHVGRVMLLGDAAHAMSPAGGQGASLALEDAMMVGRRLADGRRFDEVYVEVEGRAAGTGGANGKTGCRNRRASGEAARNIRAVDAGSTVSAIRATHRSRARTAVCGARG